MYKITDTVETGHSKFTGGSVTISIQTENILNDHEKEKILKAIDCLDHCLITDNKEFIKFSQRYFLLDKCLSIFEDIQTILYFILKQDYICTVTLGKESYTNKLKNYSNIIDSYLKDKK